MRHVLRPPRTVAGQFAAQDLPGEDRVLADLEIEHAGADEIGAVFVGVAEALPGMDRAGGHDLVGDPGFGDGLHEFDRRAVFDLYCESETGEKFIVEMQKAKQKYFKDRSVFYSTFPIREQAQRGEWDFQLNAVYTVGILDFVFDEDQDSPDYFHHHVQLMETKRQKVFFDKLTYIYLEMPKFTKTEDELETHFDKWLYVIKNLPRLQERPRRIQERVFQRLFEAAEIARFDPAERAAYEESVKIYRDLKNVIDTGREEGGLERAKEIARRMRAAGEPLAKIAGYTGLMAEQIEEL